MKCVLLDIEGTTTPIDFVHKTLFPFAAVKIGEFVRENFADIQTEISQLSTEYKKDFAEQIYGKDFKINSPETIADYLKFLIEIDRKSTALKSLQGKIWQRGYESGELESVMFADVKPAFERWKTENKVIAIYSSGSVLAQKLIFKYSNVGDLSSYISDYFDTNVGHKRETPSYRNVAEKLNAAPPEILFVSDIAEELDAAQSADFQTALMIREGNAPVENASNYQIIHSFAEVF